MSQILIIYTGGTIGMMSDPVTKVLKPINFEQIMDNVPELDRLNCKIKVHSFDEIIDSSNMNPEIWAELASIIEKYYDRVDGFVILHGSDTIDCSFRPPGLVAGGTVGSAAVLLLVVIASFSRRLRATKPSSTHHPRLVRREEQLT